MLTRGVCRAMPRFFAIDFAEVTMPRAMRPCPPSFSLANTKIVSPSAMLLPPYIVFCAGKANAFARGSGTSALIANGMLFREAMMRILVGRADMMALSGRPELRALAQKDVERPHARR